MDKASPEQDAAETPEETPVPVTVVTPAARPSQPSNAVLILGFIIIALLGALIFSLITQPPADRAEDDSSLGSGESATEIAARLREDANTLAAMVGELRQRIAAQDAIITERNRETVLALEEQKRLRDENATLRSDLNRALGDAALAQTLKRDLDNANAMIADLRAQLAQLGSEPAQLRQQLMEAERIRRDLEARIVQLESQLNQSRLFAGTESEIMKEAIELFRALRELEGKSDSEIATAYSTFGARLGANVLKTCNFPTGSAEVPVELESGIRELTDEVPDGAEVADTVQ